ncbi:uncharacterized protein [Hyperolius riggenbachi]|uniref:uncharacterized protein isoform X2 n=1 Tax=Hyperolius riggenbachi TaxID=752182 RepID=UPI0035A334DF
MPVASRRVLSGPLTGNVWCGRATPETPPLLLVPRLVRPQMFTRYHGNRIHGCKTLQIRTSELWWWMVMDRYRYFIFNQRSMVALGILQMAFAGISVVCGFIDGAFRKESMLGKTRAPLWAGVIMAVPGVLALFSSQRKNPVLVNVLIAVSVFSCFTTTIIVVYACLTLGYGEDDDEVFSHTPVHIVHTTFILNRLVQGANIAMLVASISSLFVVLCIVYMGCRSLPRCMCFDNLTGMEWLHPEHESSQSLELVCTVHGDDRIFNAPVQLTEAGVETEEPFSQPPPYVRL